MTLSEQASRAIRKAVAAKLAGGDDDRTFALATLTAYLNGWFTADELQTVVDAMRQLQEQAADVRDDERKR